MKPVINALFKRDLLTMADLDRAAIEQILATAVRLKQTPQPNLLQGKIIANCFFEASTRTRLSFAAATHRLGGAVIGFANSSATALAKKGESLADSMQVISGYADAIVIRHPQAGAAHLAAQRATVPVINAGDGANQHPTQTLLDLFTIQECQGRLEHLNIALVGDLKYSRTVHSLVQALADFNTAFTFIAPDALYLPATILQALAARGCRYRRVSMVEEAVADVDIIYMTRQQKERFAETDRDYTVAQYVLDVHTLSGAQPHLKVLHPLPRVDEMTVAVDHTPHAYYFEQAKNGLYVRQALLALILKQSL